jgi:EAL domain-containing protein (putative c-di-GMP-specific phosphodiesterase class I)
MDPDRLLHQADTAMYEAKRRGRRRYQIYQEAFEQQAQRRVNVEQEMADALSFGWLRLVYQPVIDLTTGTIVATEALLRMEHPDRGMVPPSEFIDIAEESHLILPIGEWVLHEACRQLATWQRIRPIEMAVNVAARQAADLAVTGQVLGAAQEAGVDPSSLCLEMTERVLLHAGPAVLRDLTMLTDSGVKLAIDDFGTGYSSLSYLQRFPVDTVKIDRSFVAGMGTEGKDDAIVAAVAALGSALHLTVVAEGVETLEQLDELRRLGCDRAQGYYLGHPRPPNDITDLLTAQAAGV